MSRDYEQLQRQVEEKVWALLRRRGVRGWNTAELAREVGVSKRTLYRAIRSKEEALEAALRARIAATQRSLAEEIEREGDPADHCRRTFHRLAERFPQLLSDLDPALFGEVYRSYPGIEERLAGSAGSIGAPLIDFFETCRQRGLVRRDMPGETLFQAAQAVVLYFLREEEDPGAAVEHIRRALLTLFDGLFATGGAHQ